MKSHLLFKNPQEGTSIFIGRPGGGGKEDEEKTIQKDYRNLAREYRRCMHYYINDERIRHDNRELQIENHFDLIELTFFKGYDQQGFEGYYSDTFGLILLHLSSFNRKGLFAIEDRNKFNYFFAQFKNFNKTFLEDRATVYDNKIKFIKSFKLFSTSDMIGNFDNYQVVHLSFLGEGTFIEDSLVVPQKNILEEYLQQSNVLYRFNDKDGEIYNISEDLLRFILNNFDFIYASCCGSGAVIVPGRFNIPIRDFGFEIINSNEELPIIGVIDSGVSNQTPLNEILIGTNGEFDSTGTGSFIDNTDHGTGVAAFAAFGKKLIPGYRGRVEADAKILPIKIIDRNTYAISQQKTIDLIKEAHYQYGVKIFTLTVGYSKYPLKNNQEFSSYAASLDELAAELDILIFISTTNNVFDISNTRDYPIKFGEESANIAPPAESMNNITIGAIADNFENNGIRGLAGNKEFPGIYSRKFHYNFEDEDVFNHATCNKHLRKPDILIAGGDYHERYSHGFQIFDDAGETCLEVLSANLHDRTFKALGTSYSAPLAANMASKLCKLYPSLTMQSIKALLINSAKEIELGDIFDNFSIVQRRRILGYGNIVNEMLYSEDNKVTLVIEDEILPGHIKLFPLRLPDYLNDARRNSGLLKFSSTLCFKFKPKRDNQLLYCPLHVSYAIGKNLELNVSNEEQRVDRNGRHRTVTVYDGYNGNASGEIKLCSSAAGWAQDYYYREKIVSNVQNVSFTLPKQSIINENNTFKIAINAAFHKLLSNADKESYSNPIAVSLVLTIEQNPLKGETLSSLYDELILINELVSMAEIQLEAEV